LSVAAHRGRDTKVFEPVLSVTEAAALIRLAATEPQAPHLPDFIQLALNTGMRSGELLGLEWRRVDLNGSGLILLEGHHTKAGKRRSIPINEDARGALIQRARFRAEHCPASPWVFCRSHGALLSLRLFHR
jgi:integrase